MTAQAGAVGQSCTRQIDDEGSYYLDIDHADGAPDATLRFHALGPYYAGCWTVVKDGGETTGVTHPTIAVSVPWSQLTGTSAFTVRAHGQFSDTSHQVTRDYTVTVQPVDESGNALG